VGWLLDHFGLFIVLIVGISILRGIARILRAGSDDTARQPTGEDSAAAERTRRVQEEIRRKIAERRSGVTRKVAERIPSLVRPPRVPPLDPFGGPMQRVGRKIEEMAEPWLRPADEAATQAVLERQEKLAEEMRALDAARLAQQRRASEIAAAKKAERPAGDRAVAAWKDLRGDLHDPRALRRAIVLREVLGAPVGLR